MKFFSSLSLQNLLFGDGVDLLHRDAKHQIYDEPQKIIPVVHGWLFMPLFARTPHFVFCFKMFCVPCTGTAKPLYDEDCRLCTNCSRIS